MNPAPGTSWPDLHYTDTEQVELDVCAIIARGTRLRRRRLIAKVAAAVVVAGIAPVAVVATISGSGPGPSVAPRAGPVWHAVTQRSANPAHTPTFGAAENAPEKSAGLQHSTAGGTNHDLMFSLARAVVRQVTTVPRGYGRLLAIAGARAGSGLWFTAAAAHLKLFRLNMAGALQSWPLPTSARGAAASAGVGLAVSTAGVAWIGVGSTLLRLDTKSSQLSTWHLPAVADSVAVSPDGYVAVATSHSSAVSVLDPRDGTFRQIKLPSAADQPLALGYARNGTLGIGYQHLGKPRSGAVLLVTRTGAQRSIPVPQPTAVAAYGASGLLVGITKLYVVRARGQPRPLLLPADSPDLARVVTAPAPLPGGQLAIAMNDVILTFPATTTSSATAAGRSTLWVTPPPRCQGRHRCPAGYQMLASDSGGDLWVVPKADPRTVELVSLR